MNQSDAQPSPNFVTCPCQYCSGKIEFDANQLDAAGNTTALCPHCGLETIIFVPQDQKVPPVSVDGLRFQSDISRIKTPPDKFGGISGCPCFLARESKPTQLVGFATSVWTKYLFFTHARCLNSDGTINTQKT